MDWRLTAATLFCETIKRWVPIIVYKDGRTHCGYYHRHAIVMKDKRHLSGCHGSEGCDMCRVYKEDVFQRGGRITQNL
ncbi:MAG: hypothetical protein WCO26_06040 [Deltaproteobacteria bacterium]